MMNKISKVISNAVKMWLYNYTTWLYDRERRRYKREKHTAFFGFLVIISREECGYLYTFFDVPSIILQNFRIKNVGRGYIRALQNDRPTWFSVLADRWRR